MDKLGKMIRITDLRSVWPHEANDFTKWLAQEENLTLLGDAIDIELELEERESRLFAIEQHDIDGILEREIGKLVASVESKQGEASIVLGTIK